MGEMKEQLLMKSLGGIMGRIGPDVLSEAADKIASGEIDVGGLFGSAASEMRQSEETIKEYYSLRIPADFEKGECEKCPLCMQPDNKCAFRKGEECPLK